ncbi:alkaline phosphatase PafA [Daejeonia sp. YH14]|uniref:alkaline phosphatase PafA n=1 Tax=Daejeonia sp. YH14 TaxID=3439042 RepID=UPI003F498320
MIKKITVVALALLSFGSIRAQKSKTQQLDRPKLVVGLVVDQMRWDYLFRYYEKFGNDGFRRLLSQGYSLNNVLIPYVPTVTAIGHTSIYTGAVPSIHGIAGNDWYDRKTGKNVYCTSDISVQPVGTENKDSGQHSPKNLWSSTITDQLRLATNFQGKVVGVSLKDRASILPAGHNPTAAFWFDDSTGNFITSSYYMNELPKWVKDYNGDKMPEKLVANGWNTLLPIAEYTESSADDVPWENLLGSAQKSVFPYNNLAADYAKKKGIIRTTPFGNTLTLDFAEHALANYQLGADDITDFLAVNLASTDYSGHAFGPNSVEVEDVYLRLDKDLADFFQYLDKKVGQGNYLVFLSADHGGAHSVGFLQANKMMTGYFDEGLKKDLADQLQQKFGSDKLVASVMNYQIYLNDAEIQSKGLQKDAVKQFILDILNQNERILYAVDLQKAAQSSIPEPIKTRIINGYNWQRSGDIQVISHDSMLPSYAKKGTTHSVWNSYDAHIPLIFMGWKIKHGESSQPHFMTDIAPTIAQLLKIENPSGNVGTPINEVIEK